MKPYKIIMPIFSLVFYISSFGQKINSVGIGNNISYLNDWKNNPVVLFNPEISYISHIKKNNFIRFSLDILYGKRPIQSKIEGSILSRIIFSFNVAYEKKFNKFGIALGPTFRYRNEKKVLYRYGNPYPFEFVIDPDKSHFDFGAYSFITYDILKVRNNFLSIKGGYKFYNKGINPISTGIFYIKKL